MFGRITCIRHIINDDIVRASLKTRSLSSIQRKVQREIVSARICIRRMQCRGKQSSGARNVIICWSEISGDKRVRGIATTDGNIIESCHEAYPSGRTQQSDQAMIADIILGGASCWESSSIIRRKPLIAVASTCFKPKSSALAKGSR